MVLYVPPLAQFFAVTSLGLIDLLIVFGAGLLVFVVIEASKRVAINR
jgi:hypothetical protein